MYINAKEAASMADQEVLAESAPHTLLKGYPTIYVLSFHQLNNISLVNDQILPKCEVFQISVLGEGDVVKALWYFCSNLAFASMLDTRNLGKKKCVKVATPDLGRGLLAICRRSHRRNIFLPKCCVKWSAHLESAMLARHKGIDLKEQLFFFFI